MTTGTDLITTAYKKNGAYSITSPVPAEAIQDALKVLMGMLHAWCTRGLGIPFTQIEEPGDDVEENMDTTNAITDNLAIRLAPFFDNGTQQNVSATLRENAGDGLRMLWNDYSDFTIPDKGVSSTLPLGAGWRNWGYWRKFKGSGGTVGQ